MYAIFLWCLIGFASQNLGYVTYTKASWRPTTSTLEIRGLCDLLCGYSASPCKVSSVSHTLQLPCGQPMTCSSLGRRGVRALICGYSMSPFNITPQLPWRLSNTSRTIASCGICALFCGCSASPCNISSISHTPQLPWGLSINI